MDVKELLTKKFIMVGMEDAAISTNDKYIIGTEALATCTGLIENKLYGERLKYGIICGTDRSAHDYYGIINILNEHFKEYIPFSDEELSSGVVLDKNTFSKQFAFDAMTGNFVSDKVLFGLDYYKVNTGFKKGR